MAEYELVVIGSGPAGHHAAIQAAKLGRRAAIVERLACVGGVCINTGTIPSKTFREAVLYLSGYQQRGLYGAGYSLKETITMPDLVTRCDHVIKREVQIIRDQMRRNGVRVLSGTASFLDPHTLRIKGADETLEAKATYIVVAVGTVPATPEGVPVDGETVITSD